VHGDDPGISADLACSASKRHPQQSVLWGVDIDFGECRNGQDEWRILRRSISGDEIPQGGARAGCSETSR
jgi:hypothetical protein